MQEGRSAVEVIVEHYVRKIEASAERESALLQAKEGAEALAKRLAADLDSERVQGIQKCISYEAIIAKQVSDHSAELQALEQVHSLHVRRRFR